MSLGILLLATLVSFSDAPQKQLDRFFNMRRDLVLEYQNLAQREGGTEAIRIRLEQIERDLRLIQRDENDISWSAQTYKSLYEEIQSAQKDSDSKAAIEWALASWKTSFSETFNPDAASVLLPLMGGLLRRVPDSELPKFRVTSDRTKSIAESLIQIPFRGPHATGSLFRYLAATKNDEVLLSFGKSFLNKIPDQVQNVELEHLIYLSFYQSVFSIKKPEAVETLLKGLEKKNPVAQQLAALESLALWDAKDADAWDLETIARVYDSFLSSIERASPPQGFLNSLPPPLQGMKHSYISPVLRAIIALDIGYRAKATEVGGEASSRDRLVAILSRFLKSPDEVMVIAVLLPLQDLEDLELQSALSSSLWALLAETDSSSVLMNLSKVLDRFAKPIRLVTDPVTQKTHWSLPEEIAVSMQSALHNSLTRGAAVWAISSYGAVAQSILNLEMARDILRRWPQTAESLVKIHGNALNSDLLESIQALQAKGVEPVDTRAVALQAYLSLDEELPTSLPSESQEGAKLFALTNALSLAQAIEVLRHINDPHQEILKWIETAISMAKSRADSSGNALSLNQWVGSLMSAQLKLLEDSNDEALENSLLLGLGSEDFTLAAETLLGAKGEQLQQSDYQNKTAIEFRGARIRQAFSRIGKTSGSRGFLTMELGEFLLIDNFKGFSEFPDTKEKIRLATLEYLKTFGGADAKILLETIELAR